MSQNSSGDGSGSRPNRRPQDRPAVDGEICRRLWRLAQGGARVVREAGELGVAIKHQVERRPKRSLLAGGCSALLGGWGARTVVESGHSVPSLAAASAPFAVALFAVFLALGASTESPASHGVEVVPVEDPDDALRLELDREAQKRKLFSARAKAGGQTAPLDDLPLAGIALARSSERLRDAGHDIGMILSRVPRRCRGLIEIAGDGAVLEVAAQLDLEWDDLMLNLRGALDAALGPFGYHHVAFPFSVGGHMYLLFGLSGSPIPGDLELEVSRTATRIAERYVRECPRMKPPREAGSPAARSAHGYA